MRREDYWDTPSGQSWLLTFWTMEKYPLAWLVGLAAVLRLVSLGSAPLWYDEAGAVWMASLPVVKLIAATAGDVHPPLFFLILKPLFALTGPNPWLMRLPSALLGVAALPLVFSIGDHIGLPRRASLVAVAIMAVSPFELWYSQEARMYALLQFCVLLTVWAGLKQHWGVFILAATAGMYTQNFGAIYYVTFCAVLIGRELLRPLYTVRWEMFDAVLIAPVVLFSPWILVILGQLRDYAADWIPQVTLGGWLQPLIEYWWPQAMTNGFYPAVALGALLVTIIALGHAAITWDRRGAFLVWMVFVPMLGAAAFSLAWKPMYISRPFIAGAPFLYLLVAWTFTATPRRALVAACAAPIVALTLWAYYPMDTESKTTTLPAEKVLTVIRSNWLPGDVIYHGNVGTMLPLWPYTWNTWEPQYLMPPAGYSQGMLRASTRRAMGMKEIPLDQIDWQRAWLVWSVGPTIDPIEDTYIAAMLARYPHTSFMHMDVGYAQFDLWLLTHGPVALGN